MSRFIRTLVIQDLTRPARQHSGYLVFLPYFSSLFVEEHHKCIRIGMLILNYAGMFEYGTYYWSFLYAFFKAYGSQRFQNIVSDFRAFF